MAEGDDALLDEGSAEEVAEESGGSKTFMIVIVAIFLLAGGGGGYLAYANYEALKPTMDSIIDAVGLGAEPIDPDAPPEYGEFMELDGFVVNPKGSGADRMLIIALGLEAENPEVFVELGTKEIVVKDAILGLLGTYTAEEVADIDNRAMIQEKILEVINQSLVEDVGRIFFTQYILQ